MHLGRDPQQNQKRILLLQEKDKGTRYQMRFTRIKINSLILIRLLKSLRSTKNTLNVKKKDIKITHDDHIDDHDYKGQRYR